MLKWYYKKALSVVLSIILIMLVTFVAAPRTAFAETTVCGDVDFDGNVTMADAMMMMDYTFMQQISLTGQALLNADVNADGNATMADAMILMNYLSGKYSSLPYLEIFGDVDLNGQVTMVDVTLINDHISGGNQLTGQALLNADVNLDGNVDSIDEIIVNDYVSGKHNRLPCVGLEFDNTTFQYDPNGYSLKVTYKPGIDGIIMYDENGDYVAGDMDTNGLINAGDIGVQCGAMWDGIMHLEPLPVGTHKIYIFSMMNSNRYGIQTGENFPISVANGLMQVITVSVTESLDKDKEIYAVMEHFGTFTGVGTRAGKIDANYNEFTQLLLDGNVVDSSNHTVTEGSTIITLKESYLKTLVNGTYVFRAEFSDGYADITLIVKSTAANEPIVLGSNPKTGDNGNVTVWFILGGISLVAIYELTMIAYRRKKSKA